MSRGTCHWVGDITVQGIPDDPRPRVVISRHADGLSASVVMTPDDARQVMAALRDAIAAASATEVTL